MTTDYNRLLDILNQAPWKSILSVLGGSFMGAMVLSNVISYLLVPEVSKFAGAGTSSMGATDLSLNMESLADSDIQKILDRNLFNKEGTLGDVDPSSGSSEGSGRGLAKSKLPLKVVGIIYGGSPLSGLATIQNTSKSKVSSFVVGDTLMPDVVVDKIYRKRVIVRNKDRREYIDLQKKEIVRSSRRKKKAVKKSSGGVSPIATGPALKNFKEDGFERNGTNMVMSQSYKQRMLTEDFTKVLQDAKASPHIVNGQVVGFELTRIRENSVYQKAGFQNGDIVKEINGVRLTNPSAAIGILQGSRNASELDVVVSRNGKQFSMHLQVR